MTPIPWLLGCREPFSSISDLLGQKAVSQCMRCYDSHVHTKCCSDNTMGLGVFFRLLDYEVDYKLDELSITPELPYQFIHESLANSN